MMCLKQAPFYWFFSLLLIPESVQSKDMSWTLGFGSRGQILADYRGSQYYQVTLLPFPYIKLNSKYFEIDKNKVKGKLLSGDFWELNISADAALTVDTKNNPTRVGMPELFPAFELGPSLDFSLSGGDFNTGWLLRLPLRSVSEINLDDNKIANIGYIFHPRLTYIDNEAWLGGSFKSNFGAIWASQKYHRYYYAVQTQFERPDRAAYDLGSGFSGLSIKSTWRKTFDNWWLSFSLRADFLDKAKFSDSPLIDVDHYVSFSITSAYLVKKGVF